MLKLLDIRVRSTHFAWGTRQHIVILPILADIAVRTGYITKFLALN